LSQWQLANLEADAFAACSRFLLLVAGHIRSSARAKNISSLAMIQVASCSVPILGSGELALVELAARV
jgi:hypothetical protein